jgi:hypothetical protein
VMVVMSARFLLKIIPMWSRPGCVDYGQNGRQQKDGKLPISELVSTDC